VVATATAPSPRSRSASGLTTSQGSKRGLKDDERGVRCRDLGQHRARILTIYPRKGAVAAGPDADIVMWDPTASKPITAERQLSRIHYYVFGVMPAPARQG
jgi:hypothetical protein